jgi:anti-sigma-K factor RskA
MTCAEFKELVQALALGALEPDEAAACEAHLSAAGVDHDGCHAELERAREAVALLGASLPPIAPDPRLWTAIEKSVGTDAPPVEPPRVLGFWTAFPWIAAAVAASFAVFFAVSRDSSVESAEGAWHSVERQLVSIRTERNECQHDLAEAKKAMQLRDEAVALLGLPDAKVVPLAAQGGKSAHGTVVVSFAERRAVVLASGLAPVSDRDYELWVIRGDDKIAAGLLHGNDTAAVIDPALLASADAFAVTLEPAGGGPAPRGELVLVGIVPKT